MVNGAFALFCLVLALLASVPAPSRDDADARARYEHARATVDQNDVDDLLRVGKLALEQEAYPDAEALFRRALRIQPRLELAYHGVVAAAERRELPTESDFLKRARERLPERFAVHETRHFVILSDADPQWVRIQGTRFERAHTRFVQFARSLDLRPLPLKYRIVAVLFDARDDFLEFSAAEGGPTSDLVAGYYHPVENHLVFYHVESNTNVETARRMIARESEEIDTARRRLRALRNRRQRGEAKDLRRRIRDADAELAAREASLDDLVRRRTVQLTIHEAVHAVSFQCEVQSPYAVQPGWFSEGLATAFETDEAGLPFGPGRDFAPRRETFLELLDDGELIPLRELVALSPRDFHGSKHPPRVLYHQSYALVTWLCRYRKPGVTQYVTAINNRRGALWNRERQLAVFEDAFGDIDDLERIWLTHVDE